MDIRNATVFWIEAGAMSSASRHQVELPNHLAEFFDQHSRDTEQITFQIPSGEIISRPFVYRGTDYGQWTEQWRLHLPTSEMGGPEYPGRILTFERIRRGNVLSYLLTVIDPDTPEAHQLEDRAGKAGTIGSTGVSHGRSYGYW
ncbi:MAG: hypothetical protein ABSC04_21165 [Syntrophobacteraceae bacterium]|jgi:hypothetical protein